MNLDQPSAPSIQALEDLLQAVDISKVKKNLRLMLASFLMSEESRLIDDHLEFMLEMKSVYELLEALEKEASIELCDSQTK